MNTDDVFEGTKPSLLLVKREAIKRLIDRYETTPDDRARLLVLIRTGQERSRVLRRYRQDAEPLAWVDSWSPPR